MELVLGTHALVNPAGSETYLVTVAEHLQRLGHGVTLVAEELGACAHAARAGGLRVASAETLPPAACDAILVQDAATSYRLAELRPDVPQLFVAHSEVFELQQPPQLDGVVSAVIVLNERVANRVRALAHVPRVVRLRQPIDTDRFAPTGAVAVRPKRALALGNYLRGPRLAALEQACREHGLALERIGKPGELVQDPREQLARADVVFAKGRAILEAMACGRAAYLYDQFGGGGWVTPDRYAELEADGFGGTETSSLVELDLAGYSPKMGPANRDLVIRHHAARRHAQELVEVLRELAPGANAAPAPLAELSRLVRNAWQLESVSLGLRFENERLNERVRRLEDEVAAAAALSARVAELEAIATQGERVGEWATELERTVKAKTLQLEQAERGRNEVERRLHDVLSTRRFRLGHTIARPFDAARRLVRR